MLFEKKSPLPLLACAICGATGISNGKNCSECGGLAMGHYARGRWLFWGSPLTRYNLALEKARRIFNKVRFATALILGLNFWIWAGLLLYQRNFFAEFLTEPRLWSEFYKLYGAAPAILLLSPTRPFPGNMPKFGQPQMATSLKI